jgi:hypothetical protein
MLITLTIVSSVVALVMGALAWRLTQEERRRSDARVAALVASLDDEPSEDPTLIAHPGPLPARLRQSDAGQASEGRGNDDRGDRAGVPAPDRPVFATSDWEETSGLRRLATAGVAGLGIVALALISGLTVGWLATGAGRTAAPVVATEPGPPLELLSLTASRSGLDLSIAGLVRNPPTGAALDRVAAIVFFFDEAGGFLTSARAPLERPVLAPGDECPFHVTVAAPENTSRYRVSFRAAEGGVVSHVDRRPMRTEQRSAPDAPPVRRAGL